MTARWQVALGALTLVVLAGCGDGAAWLDASRPATERGPVALDRGVEVEVWADPDRLSIYVPSCNGEPEAVRVEQDPDAVRVEVVTTQVVGGPAPDCADSIVIPLAGPLGEREVIDLVSGASLPVGEEQVELVCLETDLVWEPVSPTPEEALAVALRGRTPSTSVPIDVDAYVRSEREPGIVAFELVVDEHIESTWLVRQDDDGRWGVVSLSACEPA